MKIFVLSFLLTSCGPIHFMVKNPKMSKMAVMKSFKKMNDRTKKCPLKAMNGQAFLVP
ncbi:MAG: hypothetical protein K2Q22_09315 [Cytophagales bacterium]|nr:hypothetical protein [Cytophagales bacterium]